MRLRGIAMIGLAALAGCAPAAGQVASPSPAPAGPTRVVLFIGDGVGTSYWTAALFAAGRLAVEQFPVVGLVDTRSSSHYVTDSAAGATVYATGIRTFNGAIGVGPDSLPRRTVLEIAEEKGMATGLVATSSITHATPASFAAHVVSRRAEPEIARQFAEQEIDVLLGGGRDFFDGAKREDGRDLLGQLKGRYAYVETAEQLRALRADTVKALLGLFAPNGLEVAPGRTPTLPEMTSAALSVLDRNPRGFFLMVEGSQPDWRGHDNRPLEEVVAEMLDFDRAIQAALDYQARNPETLVVVVADHETGGLALQMDQAGQPIARYTTTGHTGAMIPLFARGPGAERFGGIQPNTRIGELLLEAVRGTGPVERATSTPQ